MKYTASYLIEKYDLQLNPEGGHYREIYKDPSTVKADGFDGDRSCSTAIYYLLKKDETSIFHQIKSDELWHYYFGSTHLHIYEIKPDGTLKIHSLGNNIDQGDALVCAIEKHSWFAAELVHKDEDAFALVGCTVAPGFEFRDFKVADADDLSKQFPQHQDIIRKLSHSIN
ncbi:uncharacterized protein BX664DRAFT_59156 [Halteromyces radiatus]|uniref:uncharacterized protein n=1 Tax=Halteromyces radiatus TaxID=101107 RepID=UPI00221E86B7|nr:uncharacterized protein BX664DRAFT_59156 [Halteromyces radiatus]KAI8096429.1 hypothetical protein BX664DRAFT_59156 [Halteromyces radiatus]